MEAPLGRTPRPGIEEDEDWTRYLVLDDLDLDDPDLSSLLDEISLPALTTGLEALHSSSALFGSDALNTIVQPRQIETIGGVHNGPKPSEGHPKRGRGNSSPRNSISSTRSSQPLKKKARKTRFTTTQVDILDTWLNCHLAYPYPQQKEKEDLAAATGLKVGQIQAWFARTRQRRLNPTTEQDPRTTELGDLDHLSPEMASRPIPQYDGSPQQSWRGSSSMRSRGPGQSSLAVVPASPHPYYMEEKFEIWEPSLDDNEGQSGRAEPSDLSRGAAKVDWWLENLPNAGSEYDSNTKAEWDSLSSNAATQPSPDGAFDDVRNVQHSRFPSVSLATPTRSVERSSNRSNDRAGYLSPVVGLGPKNFLACPPSRFRRGHDSMSVSSSSLGTNLFSSSLTSAGSDQILTPAPSVSTWGTTISSYSFSRRRGRRMPLKPRSPPPQYEERLRRESQELKFCCTFCSERFKDKYRWRRHEESMHAPQKAWTCKSVRVTRDQHVMCPLCYFLEDTPAQCMHDMQPCWARPVHERTFYRKDNLVQHLEGVHNARAGINSSLLAELTEGISSVPYDLTCHFCQYQNPTWEDRVTHVAKHFEDGMTMVSWKPPTATKGEPAVMDQFKPYIPRLSRLWTTEEPKLPVEGQRKRQRSRSISEPWRSHLPRIVVEDYSEAYNERSGSTHGKADWQDPQISPTALHSQQDDNKSTASQHKERQPYKKIKFKEGLPKKSLKSKIGKLLTRFSISPNKKT